MIVANLFCNKQGICAFTLKGHSGYAEAGSDIVCAAVSSIAQYMIGVAEHIQLPCRYELKDGLISFSLTGEATEEQLLEAQNLLIPFETALKQLSETYGKYLKISRLEV